MKDIQKVYDEGREACKQNISPESNPYGVKDQRFYAWINGHTDTELIDMGFDRSKANE